MKAAVLAGFKEPLRISEVPPPQIEKDEILIRLHACGICHSDLHVAQGDWPLLNKIVKKPLILGHEIAGVVERAGSEARGFKPGDRVGVPWIYWTCGECEFCAAERENLCLKQEITGVTVDGGFAEFAKAKASHAAFLPENLDFKDAAPLLCAGLTVYRALKVSGARPGDRVGVFGVGGLGHLGIQIAKALGMKAAGVDVTEEKMKLAQDCGADWAFLNTPEEPVHRKIQAIGGLHAALVTASNSQAYQSALRSLRRAGTLVVIGMPVEDIPVSAFALVSGEIKIVSSAVGTRQDLNEVLHLAAQGKIHCKVESRPLSQINEALQSLQAGQVSGRLILVP